jgi:hypothetical protein
MVFSLKESSTCKIQVISWLRLRNTLVGDKNSFSVRRSIRVRALVCQRYTKYIMVGAQDCGLPGLSSLAKASRNRSASASRASMREDLSQGRESASYIPWMSRASFPVIF